MKGHSKGRTNAGGAKSSNASKKNRKNKKKSKKNKKKVDGDNKGGSHDATLKKGKQPEAAQPMPRAKDPWSGLKSAWGGRASPAEEMDILKGKEGTWTRVRREDIVAVGGRLDIGGLLTCGTLEKALSRLFGDGNNASTVASEPVGDNSEENGNEGQAVSIKCATANGHHVVTTVTAPNPTKLGTADVISATAEAPLERASCERLQISSCDIGSVDFSLQLQGEIVALNLSDNRFTPDALKSWDGRMWLRELVLSGNRLQSFPDLSHLDPTLLKLDLSHNPEIRSVCCDAAANTFARLTRLRDLSLRACGLDTLHRIENPQHVAVVSSASLSKSPLLTIGGTLEALDVSHNAVSGGDAGLNHFLALSKLQRLTSLSLSGNPACDANTEDYRAMTKALCLKLPALKFLDDMAYSRGAFTATRATEDKEASEDLAKTGEDSSTCSCLFGNPCQSAYSCLDFNNRFEVAKKARAKMVL